MPLLTTPEIEQCLGRARQSFLAQYARLGGHSFYGFQNYGDPRNYKGPLIWSEGDVVFRFALELEREFPQRSAYCLRASMLTCGASSTPHDPAP